MSGRAALSESALWPAVRAKRRRAEKRPAACESWFLAGCGMRGARWGVAGLLAKLRGLRHDRDGREGELIASPGAGRGEARVLWPRWNVAPERLPLARVVLDAGCNGDYWQVQHQTARCVGLRHRTACAISNGTTALCAVAIRSRLSPSPLSPSPGPLGNSNGVTHGIHTGVPVAVGEAAFAAQTQSVPQTTRFVVGEREVCGGGKAPSGLARRMLQHQLQTPPHTVTPPDLSSPPPLFSQPMSVLLPAFPPSPLFVSSPRRGRAVQERDQGYPPPV